MRTIALAACLILTLTLQAQFPIGHATPVGGFAPALFAEPLWLANPGYGYRIQGAPPGGAAMIALSPGRQDQSINGLQVYLDLGNIILSPVTVLAWPKKFSAPDARRDLSGKSRNDAMIRVGTVVVTLPESSATIVLPASTGY